MKHRPEEDGFILVLCLLVLVVLSIIGIAGIRNSSTELQISGNDRLQKKTFYAADGGSMVGAELIEHSLDCTVGFTDNANSTVHDISIDGETVEVADLDGKLRVYDRGGYDLAIYLNQYTYTNSACELADGGDPDSEYVIGEPVANINTDNIEQTSMWFTGGTKMLPGGALQMAAGYEGKGKGASVGGSQRTYEIVSRNTDARNSVGTVLLGWRHIIGQELNEWKYCN